MTGPVSPWHLGLDTHGAGLVLTIGAAGATLLAAWGYAAGLRRTLRTPARRRYLRRTALLLAGSGSLIVVSVPPVGELLEERLATHMAQHMVIILVAAPLLALAGPGPVVLAGMPSALRRPMLARLRRTPSLGLLTPHVAWVLHIGALWAWHLPGAYDQALRSPGVHLLEHATFLLTAWLFWWHVVRLARRRLRGPAAAVYVVAAVPPGAALGAVLTFADHPLYPAQAHQALAAGASALTDQRIGGLVMWVPLDLAYLALAIWLFGRWLGRGASPDPDLPTLPADARPAEVVR